MSEDKNSPRVFPISGLLLMFAALGVIIFNKVPLEGSRPDVPEIREPNQKVKARLWQDPFQAVLDDPGKESVGSIDLNPKEDADVKQPGNRPDRDKPEGKKSLVAPKAALPVKFNRQVHDRIGQKGTLTVVGVMVPGDPYAEEHELRIRRRYAALSAISRLGFAPDDPDHLDFITLAPVPKAGLCMTDIMPFEWFKRGNDSILLLWINEEVFKEKPMFKLTNLSLYLAVAAEDAVPFKVIGPAGSGALQAMLAEVKDWPYKKYQAAVPAGRKDLLRQTVDIYSPTATVDDSILLEMYGDSNFSRDASKSVEAKFKNAGFSFQRTTCTDRDLAEAVFNELRLRGINCQESRNHLVLVSEWDTYYGRSLAGIYQWVAFNNGAIKADSQIHSFSYMRGIDGKLPGRTPPGGESKANPKSEDKKNKTQELEHAMGMSQFDYIRRLTDQIYRFEQQLNGGKIKAIGILGSDFHDKFLLLQALRQRFPQTIFFTTDLDARMLHPDAVPSTRNMLVASSFDLGLRGDDRLNVQGGVPPFRDSSQTSIFFTILKSFAQNNYLETNIQHAVSQKPRPKIFEIGRSRAVDLSESPDEERSFYPKAQEANNSMRMVRKVLAISFMLIVLLAFSNQYARTLIALAFTRKKRAAAAFASLLALALFAAAFCNRILLFPQSEEPFSFLEGVSVWPTEFLRLFAALLSLFFIGRAMTDLESNRVAICRQFGLELPVHEPAAPAMPKPAQKDKTGILGDLTRMCHHFSDVTRYSWSVGKPAARLTIDRYWSEYCRRDSWKYRIRRLAPLILSYFATCWLLISLDRPETPVRGGASVIIDRLLLGASVFSMTLLIFYAFDVIRTCRSFTDLLAEKAPHWTDASFARMIGEHVQSAERPMGEWMLINLIAARTEAVGKVIFYPFIVWSILFISRLNLFDNWHTPIGLAIVISFGAVYAWSCAWILRHSAEKARHAALHRLVKIQAAVLAGTPEGNELRQIAFAAGKISATKGGAFAPFTQNPVIQALLVPFGGLGGGYLLELLGKLNI
jgi:hypothetical protein